VSTKLKELAARAAALRPCTRQRPVDHTAGENLTLDSVIESLESLLPQARTPASVIFA
jgi:methylphosphotriester-DNA--protein-cysteine methyltransferase